MAKNKKKTDMIPNYKNRNNYTGPYMITFLEHKFNQSQNVFDDAHHTEYCLFSEV